MLPKQQILTVKPFKIINNLFTCWTIIDNAGAMAPALSISADYDSRNCSFPHDRQFLYSQAVL
ncbi:hypothetical protein Salpa_5741 [Sporomusa sp. KB1]|jgi:hypothetical protein|nr:hypothetical protein Salpa_5741 [Sporomusa sp. KB1]